MAARGGFVWPANEVPAGTNVCQDANSVTSVACASLVLTPLDKRLESLAHNGPNTQPQHPQPRSVDGLAAGCQTFGECARREAFWWNTKRTGLAQGHAFTPFAVPLQKIKQRLFCKLRFSEVGHLASMFR